MKEDVFCNVQNNSLGNKRNCISTGLVYTRNVLCHKHNCNSKWRLCPSCVLQGDTSKPECQNDVFSIGKIGDENCPFCEFHSDYGSAARRGDSKLIKLELKEITLHKKNGILKIGNSEFKIVPIPLLSDFEYENHDRIRKIVSSGLGKNVSENIAAYFEGGEAINALKISLELFCDMNADMLLEMEELYALNDFSQNDQL